jgi:hypothetical protein
MDENSDDSEADEDYNTDNRRPPEVQDLFNRYAKEANVGSSSLVYQRNAGMEIPGSLLEKPLEDHSEEFTENPNSEIFGSARV